MRKIFISALLFPILLALTVPAGSQTRPRRVEPAANTLSVSSPDTRAQERPRVATARTPSIREGGARESRWPGILLGTAISIGAGRIGHGTGCSPSRGDVMRTPRFLLPEPGR